MGLCMPHLSILLDLSPFHACLTWHWSISVVGIIMIRSKMVKVCRHVTYERIGHMPGTINDRSSFIFPKNNSIRLLNKTIRERVWAEKNITLSNKILRPVCISEQFVWEEWNGISQRTCLKYVVSIADVTSPSFESVNCSHTRHWSMYYKFQWNFSCYYEE